MKTQIIQLEPHDDIYSAMDKMGWGQTARILLVWPARGSVLNRRLDLIMLKRHSAELGSQLAMVVRNPGIRFHAASLGIPLYNSIRKAEGDHWRPDRKQRIKLPLTIRRQSTELWRKRRLPMNLDGLKAIAHPPMPAWIMHPITRVTAFTLGVLGVLAIAVLLVPSADIHLSPETRREEITISVAANPEYQSVDLSGTVPARWETVIVEGRGSLTTSGSIPIPDRIAKGEATFTNLTDQTIPLPVGIVVSTLDDPPIRFITSASNIVPPGEEGTTVPVEALAPGAISNIAVGSILAIEGSLGLELTVINFEPTSGGTDRNIPAPNEADYEELYAQLYETLALTALAEIGEKLVEGDLLISEDAQIVGTQEESFTPSEPAPTDQLELVLRLEFQALTVSGEDLRELAHAALETNLPESFTPDPGTLELTQLSSIKLNDDHTANWRMRAEWKIDAQLEHTEAIKLAIGLSPEKAVEQLTDRLPLAEPAEISPKPSWWPRLPFLPFRISVSSGN
ncbi:MAG: baseplate J/gp47 family protein [Anaerolineales bacterium]|nr:baseplate J/gp47 family protein [Chloroflexota bacterium]MBL6981790.1 baseplate J/gp47 family protein [Anaerolineales bacterium]